MPKTLFERMSEAQREPMTDPAQQDAGTGVPPSGSGLSPSVEPVPSLRYPTGWPRAATPCDLVPLWAGEFKSHSDWVNFATQRLTGCRHKYGHEVNAICVDSFGRRCTCGGDMKRAEQEGAFPVRYFWECTPAKAIEAQRAETQGSVHESANSPNPPQQGTPNHG